MGAFDRWMRDRSFLLLLVLLCIASAVIYRDFLSLSKLYLFKDIGSDSINALFPELVHNARYLREEGLFGPLGRFELLYLTEFYLSDIAKSQLKLPTRSRGEADSREPLGPHGEPASLPAAGVGNSLGAQRGSGGAAAPDGESVAASFTSASRRHSWAELLQRVFEVDALRCPSCGERMRMISAITDPMIARRILTCLGLPPRAPPLTPPEFPEPTPGSWFSEPEAFDFDQTPPVGWDQGG
jgi:hypothetical protein